MSVWDKLDSGLASIYANYLHVKRQGPENVGHIHPVVATGPILNVSLQYAGDLAEIEALGFQTVWKEGEGRATGTIDLANIERLTAHPGVLKMSFGRPKKPSLDKSVPDIKADQVWSRSGAAFTGNTGAGVIVGIIDTGIDVRHPFFRKTAEPKGTRILRIWDQGLQAQDGDKPPDAALIGASTSYGVEYNPAQIVAGIGGVGNFRHRDCDGHGTHVASIAAGNGQDKFKFIGVAPEADLIIVKHLYLQQTPKINGGEVDEITRFKHAVTYILSVAKNLFHKPIVINCSFGDDIGAHDGFSDNEDFVTDTFRAVTGQAIVFAAGNEAGSNQHARIEFKPGGSVDIPIKLYDERTDTIEFSTCKKEDLTHSLAVDIYYPAGLATLSVALQLPLTTAFIPGPALGAVDPVEGDFQGKRHYSMIHKEDTVTLRNGRGTVTRNHFKLEVSPQDHVHFRGTYTLQIAASDALKPVHLWCDQNNDDYGFRVNGQGDPTLVTIEDRCLIAEDAGAENAITVAAYNAEDSELPLSDFSSRGPLANYGGTPPQPAKPDVAAPGEHIDAAKSDDAKPKTKKPQTVAKDGTSMAAPHVTGVVALMLEKDPNLTVATIASTISNFARPRGFLEQPEEFGSGRLDAKSAFDNTP